MGVHGTGDAQDHSDTRAITHHTSGRASSRKPHPVSPKHPRSLPQPSQEPCFGQLCPPRAGTDLVPAPTAERTGRPQPPAEGRSTTRPPPSQQDGTQGIWSQSKESTEEHDAIGGICTNLFLVAQNSVRFPLLSSQVPRPQEGQPPIPSISGSLAHPTLLFAEDKASSPST